MPLVSVVIPLYNKELHIERTINSVLAQNIQDFELLIIDDGSTDKSAEVVKSFTDPRILLIHQENAGVSAARNRGIKEAKADLIAFLDADDEWTPSFLETVLRLREKYPEAGAYATAVSTVYNGTIIHSQYHSVPSPNWEGIITDYFRSLILGDVVLCSSSVAIPRNILQEMNGFVIDAKWGEDLDLWGRIGLNYSIGFSTSRCSLIHVVSSDALEKIYSRVTVTRENPFIKSADAAIERKYSNFIDKNYLILYLDKIIIDSARYNAIIGRKNESEEILRKCRTKAFFFTKIFLKIWYTMPEYVIKKSNRTRDNSLLFILSNIQFLELRILGFIIEHRKDWIEHFCNSKQRN